MDDENIQEFDLDDIMREFGGSEQDADAPGEPVEMPDMTEQDPSEENTEAEPLPVLQEEPVPEQVSPAEMPKEPVKAAAPEAVTQNTIRLDTIAQVSLEDTEPVVRVASPLKEDEEMDTPEEPEPFSEGWEPEYEQPMGEYVPPQPIVFHPRSRLRELKRKLIAGPEKRYYELAELGSGKLQAAIFLSLLVVLLSACATVLYSLGMVQENRMRLMVFGQFFAMLVSALIGSFQLIEGAADILKKRFSLNSLLVFTFIACCVDGVLGLREQRVSCCAAFSLEVTMSLWAAYHRRTTEQGEMDTMRKATRLDALVPTQDYYDGKPGILRREGQVEDFMDTYAVLSRPEKVQSVYAIVALGASVAIGITAGVLHGLSMGVQAMAVALLAAAPASAFVTLSRPMAVLEQRLHRLGTVLCGWQGVSALSKKSAFPLFHGDLFPGGAAKLNGVKFYGSREPDQVVAYCTALMTAASGGGLAPLFTQLLDSRNGRHYDAEKMQGYPGGIGGEVNGESVAVGTAAFLREMGVEIPEGIRVNQALYVAVDGELSGLFAIAYGRMKTAAAGLTTLCAYRGLQPVLLAGDFMISGDFLRSKFGVNPRRIAIPEGEERTALQAREPLEEDKAAALTTQEGLAPMAFAVTGAKALKTAWRLGLVVHILGGGVGLVMMLILAIIGARGLLSPGNLFLYELVWMIPGLLITEWTRSI